MLASSLLSTLKLRARFSGDSSGLEVSFSEGSDLLEDASVLALALLSEDSEESLSSFQDLSHLLSEAISAKLPVLAWAGLSDESSSDWMNSDESAEWAASSSSSSNLGWLELSVSLKLFGKYHLGSLEFGNSVLDAFDAVLGRIALGA